MNDSPPPDTPTVCHYCGGSGLLIVTEGDEELTQQLRRGRYGPYWQVRYAAADRIEELRALIASSELAKLHGRSSSGE